MSPAAPREAFGFAPALSWPTLGPRVGNPLETPGLGHRYQWEIFEENL